MRDDVRCDSGREPPRCTAAPNVQVLSSYFLSRRRTIPSTWSTAPYVVVIILSTWSAKSAEEQEESRRTYERRAYEERTRRMERRDRETHDDVAHYKTLGVDTHASEREIAKAYRRAALEWHPDKHATNLKSSAVATNVHSINEAQSHRRDDSRNVKHLYTTNCLRNVGKVSTCPQNFHPPVDPPGFSTAGKNQCSALQLRLLRTNPFHSS